MKKVIGVIIALLFVSNLFAKNASSLKVFFEYPDPKIQAVVVGTNSSAPAPSECINIYVELLDEDGKPATAGPNGENLGSLKFAVDSELMKDSTDADLINGFASIIGEYPFNGKPSSVVHFCYNNLYGKVPIDKTEDEITVTVGKLVAKGKIKITAPKADNLNVVALGSLSKLSIAKIGQNISPDQTDITNGVNYRVAGDEVPFEVYATYNFDNKSFTTAPNLEGVEVTVVAYDNSTENGNPADMKKYGKPLGETKVTIHNGVAVGKIKIEELQKFSKVYGDYVGENVFLTIKLPDELKNKGITVGSDNNTNADVKFVSQYDRPIGIKVFTVDNKSVDKFLIGDNATGDNVTLYVWTVDQYGNLINNVSIDEPNNGTEIPVEITNANSKFKIKTTGNQITIRDEDNNTATDNDTLIYKSIQIKSGEYSTFITGYVANGIVDISKVKVDSTDNSSNPTAGITFFTYILKYNNNNLYGEPWRSTTFKICALDANNHTIKNAISLSSANEPVKECIYTTPENNEVNQELLFKIKFYSTQINKLKFTPLLGALGNDGTGKSHITITASVKDINPSAMVGGIKLFPAQTAESYRNWRNPYFFAVAGPVTDIDKLKYINRIFTYQADNKTYSAFYVYDIYGNLMKVFTQLACVSSLNGSVIPEVSNMNDRYDYYLMYSSRDVAGKVDNITCKAGDKEYTFQVGNIIKVADGFNVKVIGPKFENAFSSDNYTSYVYPGSFIHVQIGANGALFKQKLIRVELSGIEGAELYDKDMTKLSSNSITLNPVDNSTFPINKLKSKKDLFIYVPDAGTLKITVKDTDIITPLPTYTYYIPVKYQDRTAPTISVEGINGGIKVIISDDNGINVEKTSVILYDANGNAITENKDAQLEGTTYTVTYTNLPNGTYTVSIKATDKEGNTVSKLLAQQVTFVQNGAPSSALEASENVTQPSETVTISSKEKFDVKPQLNISEGDTPDKYFVVIKYENAYYVFTGTELQPLNTISDLVELPSDYYSVKDGKVTFNIAEGLDAGPLSGKSFEIWFGYSTPDGKFKYNGYTLNIGTE